MQYSVIVNRLESYRKKYDVVQTELADDLEITQSQYSKLEKGTVKLPYDIMYKLYKRGWDIDLIITGEGMHPIIDRLKPLQEGVSEEQMVSICKLCEWAIEQWNMQGAKEDGIGNRLLKLYIGSEHALTTLQKLRALYKLNQDDMAELVGVNVKKYRELEKGTLQLDAELMSNIYEATQCKPSFFLDENSYYLAVVSDACRDDEKKIQQLQRLLEMQDKFLD